MKKLLLLSISLIVIGCASKEPLKTEDKVSMKEEQVSERKPASQSVRGYIKSNGTYVAPYIRSSPNGTTYDNIRQGK